MAKKDLYISYELLCRVKEKSDQFIIRELKERNIEGIVPSHGEIVMKLYQSGEPLTMNDLGRLVGRTQATISVLVDKLEKKQYLVRTRDSLDRRVIRVALTEQGREFAAVVCQIAEKLVGLYEEMLAEEELGDLIRLLKCLSVL